LQAKKYLDVELVGRGVDPGGVNDIDLQSIFRVHLDGFVIQQQVQSVSLCLRVVIDHTFDVVGQELVPVPSHI
jgi:hypothetical protein